MGIQFRDVAFNNYFWFGNRLYRKLNARYAKCITSHTDLPRAFRGGDIVTTYGSEFDEFTSKKTTNAANQCN